VSRLVEHVNREVNYLGEDREVKGNIKNKVWIYAVILFTSAFIVLLFAGYSQIKLNSNIDNYKNEISSKETERIKYQMSYTQTLKRVEELTKQNEDLEAQNNSLKEQYEALKKEAAQKEKQLTDTNTEYKKYVKAQSEFIAGNTRLCADILKTVNINLLDEESAQSCMSLSGKVFDEIGKYHFDRGIKAYNNGKYDNAISELTLSRSYKKTGSYSAKALYYLAYAEYRLGNKSQAVGYMKLLTEEYPNSLYFSKAKSFIEKHGDNK